MNRRPQQFRSRSRGLAKRSGMNREVRFTPFVQENAPVPVSQGEPKLANDLNL